MLNKINTKLLENIISLFTIKGTEYLLAFVTFPYLVRVLEVEHYGLLVYTQSIVNYFVLFTDYGFNLLGPREIAKNDGLEKRGQVFANIFYAKLLLLFVSTVIFVILLFALQYFSKADISLYAVFYLNVIGSVLFPVWFFQGIQQMRYITIVNIIGRVFFVVGIFCFVKSVEDYLLAGFFQAITPIVASLCSWIILIKSYPEVLVRPDIAGIKKAFKDAWPIFTSTIAINLYTASNMVFLGLMTNNTVVGYFSGAKKIIDNITGLLSPVTQAIYPYVSKKATESKEVAISFLHKILLVLGGSNFAISIFILFFADWIVRILLGSGYEESVLLLRVLSFLPFIIMLSQIFGIQTMLTFGMQKEFSRILLCAAVFNTCIVLPMIYFYQGLGVCISITVTETFVTTTMWWVLKKNGVNLL